MKLRLKYAKRDRVKYISHLDLMRAIERALRRAKLPVDFTQGFNPRPKMTFAAALPVGATSVGEYMDIEFFREISVQDLVIWLNRCLPTGLEVIAAEVLGEKDIKLSDLNAAIYEVEIFMGNAVEKELVQGISQLLNSEEIIIEKTTKGRVRQVNIAPLIHNIEIREMNQGRAKLEMELSLGQRGNVSPPTVVSELDKVILKGLGLKGFCRREMFIKGAKGRILPFKSHI